MIEWNQKDLIDPNNDLGTVVNVKYVDVVQRYDGTWSAMYDNKYIAEELPTRQAAIKFLEDFIAENG